MKNWEKNLVKTSEDLPGKFDVDKALDAMNKDPYFDELFELRDQLFDLPQDQHFQEAREILNKYLEVLDKFYDYEKHLLPLTMKY